MANHCNIIVASILILLHQAKSVGPVELKCLRQISKHTKTHHHSKICKGLTPSVLKLKCYSYTNYLLCTI